MLRARASGETFVSATMCPQQCFIVCQGLKAGPRPTRPLPLIRTVLGVKKFQAALTNQVIVILVTKFVTSSPVLLIWAVPQAAYCLTCKLSHVWFKVQFGQIYICGNFVIIRFLSLEFRPVVVDAAVIQLKRSIVS